MAEPRRRADFREQPRRKAPTDTPARVARPISPARWAAFDLLGRIGSSSAHSDDLLHGPRLAGLSQEDRDLCTALVLGVLRWQIALDARIRPLLSRPESWPPEPVVIALRLGMFQLLHMNRIPPHAALNESVELVRAAGQPQAAGMVNALLRKLVGTAEVRRPLVESTAAIAERLGHPKWLTERWIRHYGRAATEQICAFDQQEPRSCTVFAPRDEDADLPRMDAGSRLVAELAAAAVPRAQRVWDCCAAPGGKALVLAHRFPGAEMLATDASPKRLERLAQRFARELPGRTMQTRVEDAAAASTSPDRFDLILCDVPCSGTGTLARNPEIRHRLRPEDLSRQRERQGSILNAALQRLAPGGCLVYATCSLEPEECEEVVEQALQRAGAGVRQLSIRPLLETLRTEGLLQADEDRGATWVRNDHLRTLPGANFDGDGFFAALFTQN